ncbi:MarR family transcriptional regulator [Streptomyces sp. NA04227]|uniref:MarR family winged helix-turn-helix transcriptional regulator n=1 Tax=Streptomyces sp. NA04227 TaxID=2742136 RepID=UPI001590C428|nr:MarR family transcriptional regulator [Streptomyces sp. NA04227]QKW05252.1 MarR family transcriptional regulator [Streptomyces sp. NA04227]
MTTPPSAPPASSDQAVWDRVLILHAQVERHLAQALQRQHGIGLSEFRALADLARAEDGELRMQELADRIGLGQSSVTRLVGRLDAAGFAYKDLCPADKRGVYAVITDEGRQRYNAARTTYAEVLSSALNTAGTDPAIAGTVQALRSSL